MIETYRMLGRAHEADLAREAEKWQQASLVQAKAKRRNPASMVRWNSLRRLVPARLLRRAGPPAPTTGSARSSPLIHMALSANPIGASSRTEGERR
jgi:hypothetical protein